MTEPLEANQLMKIAEVCAVLDISHDSLERLRKRGEFPAAISVGGRAIRFRRSDVDRWLAARQAS